MAELAEGFERKADIYSELRFGAGVILRFGSRGEQYAIVMAPGRSHKRVRIWRAKSASWTKPRAFTADEIVRRADLADRARFKVKPLGALV